MIDQKRTSARENNLIIRSKNLKYGLKYCDGCIPMKFERPPDLDPAAELDGTVIVPKEKRSDYPIETFQLHFTHSELAEYGSLVGDILSRRGDEYVEIDLKNLALLIWEHRQYCDAQEFSISTVRIHRVVQELSERHDRFFPRDIQSHQLTEKYTAQTIRNGLKKLVKEGFVEEGKSQGEYHFLGASNYLPPENLLPLNDLEDRLEE